MRVSRRKVLALVGGGVVVAAGAGAAGFALTRTPTRALEPWRRAGGYDEPRRRALSYAILAPNPHNRQPWLADLRQPGEVTILRDHRLRLPETDPYDRQLTIGMGCFLELLSMAAAEDGYRVGFELFPEGDDGPVAIARFAPGGTPDPLFRHVLDRRSCKEPYEARPVPEEMVRQLSDHARIVVEPELVTSLVGLTWAAWQVEAKTPRTLKESVDLMRFGKAEIEANPDGIDLGGPMLEAMMMAGMLDRAGQLDRNSASFDAGLRLYERILKATPAYAVVITPGNTRLDQIEAGRRWVRLNLATTALGLGLHPVSQTLQEYRELSQHRRRAHELLAELGQAVQMLGRLGFGPAVPPAPRWPLERRLANG